MYTVQYFIKKFDAIPEDEWYMGDYQNPVNPKQRCAFGHCRETVKKRSNEEWTPETKSLDSLFMSNGLNVARINDGDYERFKQPTPKQRILAALKYIGSKQKPAHMITEPNLLEGQLN